MDRQHGALRGHHRGRERHSRQPAKGDRGGTPRGIAIDGVRRGVHPLGGAVHQRLAAEHVRAGGARARGEARRVRRGRRLQVRADQDEVSARGLPHQRRDQADEHRELQPPGQQ